MPPNVTNVVPEVLVVTAQKKTSNSGEFDQALATATDNQATPGTSASGNAAGAKAPDADANPKSDPSGASLADMVAAMMALLMPGQTPPVLVAPAGDAAATPVSPSALAVDSDGKADSKDLTNGQPLPQTPADQLVTDLKAKDDAGKAPNTKADDALAKAEALTPKTLTNLPAAVLAPETAQKPTQTAKPATKEGRTTSTTPHAASDLANSPEVTIQPAVPVAPIQKEVPGQATLPVSSGQSATAPTTLAPAQTVVAEVKGNSLDVKAFAQIPEPLHSIGLSIVRLAAQQGQEVRLQLHPESLGRVDVRLSYQGSDVHVQLSAEASQTGHLLQQHKDDLRAALNDAGVKVGQLSVSVKDGQTGQPKNFFPEEVIPVRPVQLPVPATPLPTQVAKTTQVDYRI